MHMHRPEAENKAYLRNGAFTMADIAAVQDKRGRDER